MRLIKQFIALLKPQPPKLGRWSLKHDTMVCERYVKNYYGEPGYPNDFKMLWISYGKKNN